MMFLNVLTYSEFKLSTDLPFYVISGAPESDEHRDQARSKKF